MLKVITTGTCFLFSFLYLVILFLDVSVIELFLVNCLTDVTDADKQYSSKFEKERADFNQMQYSSRSHPKERHEAGYLDPHTGTRAQYNVDANTSASKSFASSSYRSNAQNLKPTHDGLTDSSRATSGRLVDSRYVDFSKPSSTRNPYINRAEISGKDSLAPNSVMDKRYPTATEYDNRLMNFDRERRVDNRQMPDASYAGPVGKYQPPNATKYGLGDRYPPSAEVETAQNRLGAAVKKYSSPGEEDLRRTLYDKKYQMEAQKRQAEVLAGSRLQRETGEFDERGTEHRLEISPRGRYGAGHGIESEGIKSANRRLHDTVDTRLPSTTMASSSKPEQYREIARSTDPPTARKQFTKADRGKIGISSGIERDGVYSDLKEKATPKALKDDYHRDRQSVSSARKHVQIDDRADRQPSTVSDREQFQRQNGKQSSADHNRKHQTGPVSSNATRKADDILQTSERESSFSLRKMKEDLLRDQAKLDRQLITNAVVSDGRTPRFDSRMQRYDSRGSSDTYDTDFGRSSYATDKRTVRFYCFMDVTLFYI